jgi:hypothetical protein
MAPTISDGNHIARVEGFAQKSRVLRGCPQKYTLILSCDLQNYFSEKSLRRWRRAENFSDDFESAYEVLYISRGFLSDLPVSRPALRRRRLPNRRVEWCNSTIKTSVIGRGKRQETGLEKRWQGLSMFGVRCSLEQYRFCVSD